MAYNGRGRNHVVRYFESLGFDSSKVSNPADFIVDSLNDPRNKDRDLATLWTQTHGGEFYDANAAPVARPRHRSSNGSLSSAANDDSPPPPQYSPLPPPESPASPAIDSTFELPGSPTSGRPSVGSVASHAPACSVRKVSLSDLPEERRRSSATSQGSLFSVQSRSTSTKRFMRRRSTSELVFDSHSPRTFLQVFGLHMHRDLIMLVHRLAESKGMIQMAKPRLIPVSPQMARGAV